jgi:acyl-CoA thioesterase-1
MLQIISTRPRFQLAVAFVAVLAALTAGCGEPQSPTLETPPLTATAASEVEPEFRVVVLGDSLAAGMGLAEAEAFPAIVESLLREEGFDIEIVNAGVSGDTSAGGLSRIDWVLQQPADILVVELGGNDALRGQPLENTEKNLREIVRLGKKSGAAVILLGMDVPTNYGPEYTTAFAELYARIAEEEGATLVPGFVHALGADPTLLQPDGLHPTAEGHRRLANTLLPFLVELVDSQTETISSSAPP